MSAHRPDEVDPITRQLGEYWAAWGRAMNESLGCGGSAAGLGGSGFGTGFEAGGPWMTAIHQLARTALEQNLDSAGIAQAWRAILQTNGLWPQWQKPDAAQVHSVEQWFSPWLDSPSFGPAREHFSRWQLLARQQLEALAEGGLLSQSIDAVMEAAIADFEQRLRQLEIDGKPLESARALFDLWIEAAEQAWSDVAGGEAFAKAAAQASQAQLELQQSAQAELARLCQALGLPTRTEVDQAHQRIVVLERELDRLRALIEKGGKGSGASGRSKQPNDSSPHKPTASKKGTVATSDAPRAPGNVETATKAPKSASKKAGAPPKKTTTAGKPKARKSNA